MHSTSCAGPKTPSAPSVLSGAPRYARIPQACRRYGWSRSGLHRLAGKGLIRLVKLDGATLVDCESADAFMAGLPAACIRAPHGAS